MDDAKRCVPDAANDCAPEEAPAAAAGPFPIGDWLICPQTNTAERGSEKRRLEARGVSVLAYLHDHAGRVVGKTELLEAVWGSRALSDHSVAVVISGLRRSLGDDSRAPRYIQTIPRRGYRLIAGGVSDAAGVIHFPGAAVPPGPGDTGDSGDTAHGIPGWVLLGAGALVLLAAALAALVLSRDDQPTEYTAVPTHALSAGTSRAPFTALEERPVHPAFSRDGGQVAFAWNENGGFDFDIFIKPLGSEAMLRLTDTEHFDTVPVWSPQGNQIAFLRRDYWSGSRTACEVHVVSAVGGASRQLAHCAIWGRMAIDWMPDGNQIVFAQSHPDNATMRLARVSVATQEVVPLTDPPATYTGDDMARVSPDGRLIAFRRNRTPLVNDIYLLALDDTMQPAGQPERLTFDANLISDIDFSADGRKVLFTSGRRGLFKLWEVPVTGGAPVETIRSTAYIHGAALSPDGRTLILDQRDEATNVMYAPLSPPDEAAPGTLPSARPLAQTTRFDWSPDIAPNGSDIVLLSDRTGAVELWIHELGSAVGRQITRFGGPLVDHPRWSPDGSRIAFTVVENDNMDVYTVAPDGSARTRHTRDRAFDSAPVWGADGAWLYFASDRTGRFEIWGRELATGRVRQITLEGARVAQPSDDPDYIYVAYENTPGLWRVSTSGSGARDLVAPDIHGGVQDGWRILGSALYTIENLPREGMVLNRRILGSDGAPERVGIMPKEAFNSTFEISDDQRTVLFSEISRYRSRLYRVDLE